MSMVYKCDRCGATGKIEAEGDKRFTILKYGITGSGSGVQLHLCRHCALKLEDFISDPNCMETVEREDPEEVIGIGNAEKMGNLINKLTEALSEEGR